MDAILFPDLHQFQPQGYLAFGPIHILPALFMLVYRDRVVRTLALRWLARRGESAQQELEMHRPSSTRGNLVEVEQAVIGSAGAVDLNGMAMADEDDEYTLLHLAVMNEHYDAVQRLLHTGKVQVDRRTKRRGQTALFMAAQRGLLPAAKLLLEQHADVNAPSDEGMSPLFAAAAAHHTEMMALLVEHGANENQEWFGVRASEAQAQGKGEGDDSGRDDDEDGVVRKKTLRPMLRGEPGYDDSFSSVESSFCGSVQSLPTPRDARSSTVT